MEVPVFFAKENWRIPNFSYHLKGLKINNNRKKKCYESFSSDIHEPLLWALEDPVVNALLVWRSTVQAPSIDVQKQQ